LLISHFPIQKKAIKKGEIKTKYKTWKEKKENAEGRKERKQHKSLPVISVKQFHNSLRCKETIFVLPVPL
jgi:hypothetical protein